MADNNGASATFTIRASRQCDLCRSVDDIAQDYLTLP